MLNVGGIELTSEIAKSLDNDFDGDIITIFPVSETNEPVVELLEITLLKTPELVTSLHNKIQEIV